MSVYITPKRADDINSMRAALQRFSRTLPYGSAERAEVDRACGALREATLVVRRAEMKAVTP